MNGISFERVCERDIDLLLMRLFIERKKASYLFLNDKCIIESVAHSVTTLHGESDIVVFYKENNERKALLIENKIDAPAQTEQMQRYDLRGKQMVENSEIVEYIVWITAPKEYLDNRAEGYNNKMSYETLLKECETENDIFSCSLLQEAIDKRPEDMPVDENITAFWLEYYKYQEQFYPELKLHKSSCKKGPNATWPDFSTKEYIKGTKILHKSEKGYVDLEFSGRGEEINKLKRLTDGMLYENMRWEPTGKSASIRIIVKKMDFSKPFNNYLDEIKEVFEAVRMLNKLVEDKLSYIADL